MFEEVWKSLGRSFGCSSDPRRYVESFSRRFFTDSIVLNVYKLLCNVCICLTF